MNYAVHLECCGVAEYTGLNAVEFSAREAVITMARHGEFHTSGIHTFGAVLFTVAYDPLPDQVNSPRYRDDAERRWDELSDFILERGLGEFYDLPKFINPNHDSVIQSGMWILDQDKVRKWAMINIDDREEWRMQ